MIHPIPPTPGSDAKVRVDPTRLAKTRILLVGAADGRRRLTREILYRVGARLMAEAGDLDEMATQLANFAADVVLIDWEIDGGGIAATEIARTGCLWRPDIPIVAIIPSVTRDTANAIVMAGVNEVLVRPFSPAAVYARTYSAIKDRRRFLKTVAYTGPEPRPKMYAYEQFARAMGVLAESATPEPAAPAFAVV